MNTNDSVVIAIMRLQRDVSASCLNGGVVEIVMSEEAFDCAYATLLVDRRANQNKLTRQVIGRFSLETQEGPVVVRRAP